jgi:hypothetical protein
MAFKNSFYVLVALIVSTLVSYTVFNLESLVAPRISHPGFDHSKSGAPRDLSLHLHPEDHIYRSIQTYRFQWNITKGYRSPDGVRKLIYLINGWFPPKATFSN